MGMGLWRPGQRCRQYRRDSQSHACFRCPWVVYGKPGSHQLGRLHRQHYQRDRSVWPAGRELCRAGHFLRSHRPAVYCRRGAGGRACRMGLRRPGQRGSQQLRADGALSPLRQPPHLYRHPRRPQHLRLREHLQPGYYRRAQCPERRHNRLRPLSALRGRHYGAKRPGRRHRLALVDRRHDGLHPGVRNRHLQPHRHRRSRLCLRAGTYGHRSAARAGRHHPRR